VTRLRDIASCFEGIVPSPICTCSGDGVPNVTYLSIVHLIDEQHVGLSVQFFNKTRRNILENPRAQVILVEPETMNQYRLDLQFERTETSGPLFDRVCARLEAIASQSGMRDVFRLRGVDVYAVIECRPIAGATTSSSPDSKQAVDRLADLTLQLSACADLESLITTALQQLATGFGYAHSFIMVRSEDGSRLYTLASHGFPDSGVGSEIAIGDGLIGTAASRRMPVRTTHLTRERLMTRVVRDELLRAGDAGRLAEEIPLPGLPNAQSQLVLPLEARGQLLGVLCLQSDIPGRFLAADESFMQIAARQLSASMLAVGFGTAVQTPTIRVESPARTTGETRIRYYASDDSVFIDDEYVIKGVPGRILYKLLQLHVEQHRQEFTNKEIRLDPTLRLPEYQDNLEARLILLRRRLEERSTTVRLDRIGRGRLRLSLSQPIRLIDQ
jgi:adenylate cyclase